MTYSTATVDQQQTTAPAIQQGSYETLSTKRAMLLAIAKGHQVQPQQPKAEITKVTKPPTETKEETKMPLNVAVETKGRRTELVGCKFTKQQKQLILDYMREKGFTSITGEPDMTAYLTDHFRKVVPGFMGAK